MDDFIKKLFLYTNEIRVANELNEQSLQWDQFQYPTTNRFFRFLKKTW